MKTVMCVKKKKELPAMAQAPFPGVLGERLLNEVSEEAWQEWLSCQTMLINEKRLNLRDMQSRVFLREKMQEFLFEDQDVRPEGYQE